MANKPIINPSDNVSLTLNTNLARVEDVLNKGLLQHKEYTDIDKVLRLYETTIKSVTGKVAQKIQSLSEAGERIVSYSVPSNMESEIRRRIQLMETGHHEVIGETSILEGGSSPVYNAVFRKNLIGGKALTSAQATAKQLGGSAVRVGTGNQVKFDIPLTEEEYNRYMIGKGTVGSQIFNERFGLASQLSKREQDVLNERNTRLQVKAQQRAEQQARDEADKDIADKIKRQEKWNRQRARDEEKRQKELAKMQSNLAKAEAKEQAQAEKQEKQEQKEEEKEQLQHRKSVTKAFATATLILTTIANVAQKILNTLTNFAKDTVSNVNTTGLTGLSTNESRKLNVFDRAMGFSEGTGTGIISGLNQGFINVSDLSKDKLERIAIATGTEGAKMAVALRNGEYTAPDLMNLILNRAKEMSDKGFNMYGEEDKKAVTSWAHWLENIQSGLGLYFGRMMSDASSNPNIKTAEDWFNSAKGAYNPAGITSDIQKVIDEYSKSVLFLTTSFKSLADVLKGQWVDNLAKFLQSIYDLPVVQGQVTADVKYANFQESEQRIQAAFDLAEKPKPKAVVALEERLAGTPVTKTDARGKTYEMFPLKKDSTARFFTYLLEHGTVEGYASPFSDGLAQAEVILQEALKSGTFISGLTYYAEQLVANEAGEALAKGKNWLTASTNPADVVQAMVEEALLSFSKKITADTAGARLIRGAMSKIYSSKELVLDYIKTNSIPSRFAGRAFNWLAGLSDKDLEKFEKDYNYRGTVDVFGQRIYTENSSVFTLESAGVKLSALEKQFIVDLYNAGVLANKEAIEKIKSGDFESFFESLTQEQAEKLMNNMSDDKPVWREIWDFVFKQTHLLEDSGLFETEPEANSKGKNVTGMLTGTSDIHITVENNTGTALTFNTSVDGVPSGAITGGNLDIISAMQMQPSTNVG